MIGVEMVDLVGMTDGCYVMTTDQQATTEVPFKVIGLS